MKLFFEQAKRKIRYTTDIIEFLVYIVIIWLTYERRIGSDGFDNMPDNVHDG